MSKTDESEVEMVQWPQVVAYPGGAGGLGAWVDVSTGDGPECITRYFAAAPQPAPAVPAGWVPVPVEPTKPMLLAGAMADCGPDDDGVHRVEPWLKALWRDMLAAAPTAQQEPARAEGGDK